MSAMTGSGEPLTISFSACAASRSGTAGRTISHPASFSSWIWRSVALTSPVSVLVIVWTAIGAAPPMTTPPTLTGMDLRLVTFTRGGSLYAQELPRCEPLDVQEADHRGKGDKGDQAPALNVHLRGAVKGPAAKPLDDHHHDAAAVEGQQREQVREPERHRQKSDQEHVSQQALVDRLDRNVGDSDRTGQARRPQQAARDFPGYERPHALDESAHRHERELDSFGHRGQRAEQLRRDANSDLAGAQLVTLWREHVCERLPVGVHAGKCQRDAWRRSLLRHRRRIRALLLPDEAGAAVWLSVYRADAVTWLQTRRGGR